MRWYAVINNNTVTQVLQLDEEACVELSKNNQVVDIEDLIPRPEVGWTLNGNHLDPQSSNMSNDELDAFQQKAQRLFGLYLLPLATDKVGARNLKLTRESVSVDVASLAAQMASIKILLEGGALKTVRGLCLSTKPAFPNHVDILDWIISEINNFLIKNGWN